MMPSVHAAHAANSDQCEECGTPLYQAGDRVPAGTYLRVDDGSFHRVSLSAAGPLPASFDGHVALYRAGAAPCVCERRRAEASHAEATHAGRTRTSKPQGEAPRLTQRPIPVLVAADAARGDLGHHAG